MKKYYLLFLIIISLLFGCSDSSIPTEAQLDSSINGKNITVNTNSKFAMELDLNADGGYIWDYSLSDASVIKVDSTSYKPKSGNWDQVGGLTVETFYFCSKKTGQCKVNLIEHRGWESDVSPINTVQFNVIVRR
jgi:predicted secreted protein